MANKFKAKLNSYHYSIKSLSRIAQHQINHGFNNLQSEIWNHNQYNVEINHLSAIKRQSFHHI
jgi:hypothetical protein